MSGLGVGLAADSGWKGEESKRSWVLDAKGFGVEGPPALDWEVARGLRPVYLRGDGEWKAELVGLPDEDLCWFARVLLLEGGSLGVECTPVT